MPPLDQVQQLMMTALDEGPADLPENLFLGLPERVLAGMKVHANTISHARLVALEDTFPRTREMIGHELFNERSRQFLQQPGVTAKPLAEIGLGFDAFLMALGETAEIAALARFEWQWLTSYHAADASPLALTELAGLSSDDLLALELQRHPAAMASRFAPLVHELIGTEVPGLDQAEAILIARPQADVLISPATTLMVELLQVAEAPNTIGNLLVFGNGNPSDESEQAEKSMQALVALINAGALTAALAKG